MTQVVGRHRGAAILVIDDEDVVRDVLERLLSRSGYQVTCAATAAEGIERLDAGEFHLLLLDLMLPDRSGMEVLSEALARRPEQMVVMMTAFATVESAVAAMRAGAQHYLTKPFKNEEVLVVLENVLDQRALREENRTLRRALAEKFSRDRMIGKSAAIQEIFALIDQVAPTRSTVLIQGESGTGKELVAHAIHARSERAAGPFVVVPSGNMPADLLESSLFGHTRGAFTGAVAAKKGLFEAASGGTIFFDEISTVQSEVQAKLLRVLQEKEFLPLGSNRTVEVDARIVAATNVDLREMVRRGTFREDLYYRLDVITIQLPPLRARSGDVPLLAEHFLRLFAAENSRKINGLTREAMERLLAHSWPGNVRELEHAIERAVVLCRSSEIGVELLPPTLGSDALLPPDAEHGMPLQGAVERFEKALIERTLRRTGGVQKKAAELLGLKPTTLHEKIKRLGIRD